MSAPRSVICLLLQIGHLNPVDEFSREHSHSRIIAVDSRYIGVWIIEKIQRRALHIGSFQTVIELSFQGAGELFDDLNRAVQCQLLDMTLHQFGQIHHDFQVDFDDPLNAGTLHFDGGLLSVL